MTGSVVAAVPEGEAVEVAESESAELESGYPASAADDRAVDIQVVVDTPAAEVIPLEATREATREATQAEDILTTAAERIP
jgi:hypothetical protein